MTIIVGIPSNPVVLAADQLISTQDGHKFHEEKIFPIFSSHWIVALAYSGYPNIAKEAREKIEDCLLRYENEEQGIFLKNSVIHDQIEEILLEIARRYFDVNLQMLVGVSTVLEPPKLWVFDQGAFHEVDDLIFLGAGENSLPRYLKDRMYAGKYSLDQRKDLSLYLVEQAKNYIVGCGGPTNALVIEGGGQWDWLEQEEITRRLARMASKEKQALTSVLFG